MISYQIKAQEVTNIEITQIHSFGTILESTSQDSPEHFWTACYRAIAGANHALEAMEKMGNGKEFESYIAEAKMIRAFSHFLLVNVFSKMYEKDGLNNWPGIPYVDEPETVVIQQYERKTVEYVYSRIEEDMLAGMEKLGNDAIYPQPKYHFTYTSACAFASRFYLYKGDLAKAIAYSSKVFPQPSLFTNGGNVQETDAANVYAKTTFQPWLDYYATVPGSGDIKVYSTDAANPSNLLLTEMASNLSYYANSWRYGCTKLDTDRTGGGGFTNVTGGNWAYRVYSSGDNYYVPKFYEHRVKSSPTATTFVRYTTFPYFRVEELLLNRAEAYAMQDDFDKAINDLNIFCRHRIKSYNQTSHMLTIAKIKSFYSDKVLDPDNYMTKYNAYGSASWSEEKKALLQCILDFRRNEFMWEGLRYWDMIRYKEPVTHTTFDGRTNTLYPGDDRWVFQLPENAPLSGLEMNPRKNLFSPTWKQ
ncbi:MAG: RagB/SusD family nutrient uptake outer membrane protein [Prevotellaceae bacterium]|nr:RagB/SusD family nutrient uptake outer membrane protein [Prevotellaceae bacterium]